MLRTGIHPRLLPAALALLLLAGGARAGASPFGINAHVPPDQVLDALAEAGIGWVRIDVLWPLVQPEADTWEWTVYDHVVEAARARGLEIYGTLAYSPSWATGGTPGPGVPGDPRDWARFCYRAAHRYRGKVAAWGLWNEPNLSRFWEGSREEYIGTVLLPGAAAIHAADPGALVCAPDTAHLHSAHWDRWLRDVIAAAGPELDVVTHHVYPDGASHEPVTSALERDAANPWDDPSVKKVLRQAGWFGRPFWLTETGIPSNRYGTNDQANFFHNLLEDWFRPDTDLNWMSRIFFYEAADDPDADAYGILGPPPDYAPKAAYSAYRWFISGSSVDDARILRTHIPAVIPPATPAEAVVEVENTGSTTWSAEEGYRLTVLTAPEGLGVEGLELAEGTSVPPGGTAVFHLLLTGPGEETSGLLVLRVEHPGTRLFGPAVRRRIAIAPGDLPVIQEPPRSRTVVAGAVVTFTVTASGQGHLVYRWQLDGTDLEDGPRFLGTGTPRLVVAGAGPQTQGFYRCLVSNPTGTVASPEASLELATSIGPRSAPGRLRPGPPPAGEE